MYGSYQNQFQPTFQQYQQTYQKPVELVRVNGIEGAKAYQMPPNSTAALFDSGNDIMYIKQSDGAGFPTIRTFSFTEIKHQQEENTPKDYVTRKEFDELKEMVVNGKQSVPTDAK